MSHRASHRILAEELREARTDMGLPVDPSYRLFKPAQTFTCALCAVEFRMAFQRRLHAFLGCQRPVA